MTWEYRVTEEVINGESVFSIREVYYSKENHKIIAYSEESIEPQGSNKNELIADISMMVKAFSLPVLRIEFLRKIVTPKE